MLSKGLGSLLVSLFFATLPAFAQPSGGPGSSSAAAAVSLRRHAPMKFRGLRPDGTVESTNWSGYAVTGSSFTSAQGSWTVPSVNCIDTPKSYSSFWVGIDGYSSPTVEQTGTDSDCDTKNQSPDYYAWYEIYPAPSVVIKSISVSPGDQMTAQVTYNGTEFTITITDQTTGESFQASTVVSGAQRSSAEWIAEAPSGSRKILPLSDFGTVFLGSDYTGVGGTNEASDASTSGPIQDFGASVQNVVMVNAQGADKAVPSILTSDGTSFSVTWESEQ